MIDANKSSIAYGKNTHVQLYRLWHQFGIANQFYLWDTMNAEWNHYDESCALHVCAN